MPLAYTHRRAELQTTNYCRLLYAPPLTKCKEIRGQPQGIAPTDNVGVPLVGTLNCNETLPRLLTILSISKLKAWRIKYTSVSLILLVVGLEGGSYPAPFRTWKSSLPSPIILQATLVGM